MLHRLIFAWLQEMTWQVVREWRNDKRWAHRHNKYGTGLSGLSGGEAKAPWKLSTFIKYSWIGRLHHYIQLNKEAGLLHTAKQDVVVTDLGRSSLHSEQCSGCKHLSRESCSGGFCTHCHHSHLDQKKALSSIFFDGKGEGLVTLMELRLRGPWHGPAQVNNVYSFRIPLT